MNKFVSIILSNLFCVNTLSSQKTDFHTMQFPVTRQDVTFRPTLEHYPYLAVSVMFRNAEKLTDKKFLSRFIRTNYFYAEIAITYEGKTEAAPLYLLKKEKGIFSTAAFKDRTVVRKIPVSRFSTSLPSVTINTKLNTTNEAVSVIKALSDKILPAVLNPSTVFGAGAMPLFYGFFSEVVSQLSAKKEINATVNFDAFTPEETGILPHSYNAVLLLPGGTIISDSGFSVRVESNKQIKLYKNDKYFDAYPYFLIQMGLSNYLDITGTPSKFYYQRGNCRITEEEFNTLERDFNTVRKKLSDGQLAAEVNVLDLYRYKLLIETGVKSQGSHPDENFLLAAYNAFYDFRAMTSGIHIDTVLLKEYFGNIFFNLNSCINSSVNSLAITRWLNMIFPVLEKETATINNSDLAALKSYLSNTGDFSFIRSSRFNARATTAVLAAENHIYFSLFDKAVQSVLSSQELSDSLRIKMKELIWLKNQYDKCSPCLLETRKAEKHYSEMVNTENKRRNQIFEALENGQTAYSKGFLAYQKLDFLIAKTTDTLTRVSPLSIVIDRDAFSLMLQGLKKAKDALNEKLSLSSFTAADRQETDRLLKKFNSAIKEITQIVEEKLAPVFEQNAKYFLGN